MSSLDVLARGDRRLARFADTVRNWIAAPINSREEVGALGQICLMLHQQIVRDVLPDYLQDVAEAFLTHETEAERDMYRGALEALLLVFFQD